MSRFLASIATLDPEIIDLRATNATGVITLKNPGVLYGTNIMDYKTNPRVVATSDAFNKANLAFFASLFVGLQDVYGYLQNLLFILVGLFFIAKIGFDKGARALDKSKESGDTQWLSRFYVPVLAVGLFFAPIPEEAGMSSTVVQKFIRFFAVESTAIADKASAVAINIYMKKLYSTVGAQSVEGEKYIKETLANANLESRTLKKTLENICEPRYPHASTFQANDFYASRYEALQPNSVTQDISYAACRDIERAYILANNQIRDYTIYNRGIEQAYANDELGKKLSEINTKIQNRSDELGFIQFALIPAESFVIEAIGVIENNNIIKQQQDVQKQDMEQVAVNQGNSFSSWASKNPEDRTVAENLAHAGNSLLDASGGVVGDVVGQTTYFMLPGASSMYGFMKEQKDNLINLFETKFIKIGPVVKSAVNVGSNFIFLYATTYTYDKILKYLPIVVSVIAGCIAIISWIIQLLKYFYISPFVVAFSLGTKTPQKIVEFLVTGLTIFFKPVLLVLFIALALVMHALIVDIFHTLAIDQFNFIDNIQEEFWLSFITAIIKVLFQIIVPVGSIYIMWKLILTGPSWTFQILGVEQRANEIIAEGLSNKLERFSNPI